VHLNSNDAQSWYQLGWLYVRAGRHRDALEPLHLAEQLSPNDPLRFAFLIARAQAHYQMGEPERALELSERAVRQPHAHAQIEAIRIACLLQVGRASSRRPSSPRRMASHGRKISNAISKPSSQRACHVERCAPPLRKSARQAYDVELTIAVSVTRL
jgi:tetratricopeptide (TPR) repeat protein